MNINKHTFSGSFNGVRRRWRVPDLWAAAKQLPIESILIASLPEISDSWIAFLDDPTHPEVSQEWTRIQEASLNYPILLSPCGYVMDGYHRLAKAILLGQKHLLGQRFTDETLPPEMTKV